MIQQEFNLDFDAFVRSFVQNRDTSFAFLLEPERLLPREYHLPMIVFGIGRE